MIPIDSQVSKLKLKVKGQAYCICWGRGFNCCPPLPRKRGDIKSHSSICQSVRLSVPNILTLAITFALLQVELWYLACAFFVTRPFRWYHVMTLTVTFDLLQGQICCRAGDHNYLNLLVLYYKHILLAWRSQSRCQIHRPWFHLKGHHT